MKCYIMGKKKEITTMIRVTTSKNGFDRDCYFQAVDFDPEYCSNEKINFDKYYNIEYGMLYSVYCYYRVDLMDFYTSESIAYIEEVELDREFHSDSMYKLKDNEYRGNVVYNSDLSRWEIHVDYTVETIEHKDNVDVKRLYEEYNRLLKEYYDAKEDNDKLESENKKSLFQRIKELFSE